MDYNPQYVQMVCYKIWEISEKKVTDKIIEQAVQMVIDQYEDFFQVTFEDLTKNQKNFLFGLLKTEESIFSQEFIDQNNLGSSANIAIVRKSLIKKNILDFVKFSNHLIKEGYMYHRDQQTNQL